jgi:hypothetical protein
MFSKGMCHLLLVNPKEEGRRKKEEVFEFGGGLYPRDKGEVGFSLLPSAHSLPTTKTTNLFLMSILSYINNK